MPKNKQTIWQKIRELNVAEKTKEALRALWHQARELCEAIVNWVYANRHFCQALLLGTALAYLVAPFPVVGPVLASVSISLSVLYGIAAQLEAELRRSFEHLIPA